MQNNCSGNLEFTHNSSVCLSSMLSPRLIEILYGIICAAPTDILRIDPLEGLFDWHRSPVRLGLTDICVAAVTAPLKQDIIS